MSNPFTAQVGAVLSADIAVPDHEREMQFYSRVLRTSPNPPWREDLLNNLGLPIIGLGSADGENARLPLQWMPHIQVADVAESVRRAVELGGRDLMHAKGEDGSSQWAVLADPNGAAFGVIPVIPEDHLPPVAVVPANVGGVGRIAWLSLTVPDAEATRDFYTQVVGWTWQEVQVADEAGPYADYTMRAADGTPAAGVARARGRDAGLPPVWLIYLPVGDLDESLRRVDEEGGKVIRRLARDGGARDFAVVQDPVGVYLALTQAETK